QGSPLIGALPATFKVGGDALHLVSVQSAIQILRKPCLYCIASAHRASSPRPTPYRVRAGWLTPAGGAVRISFKQARPRTSLDFTVPRFTPCISATSSYRNPSISRRIRVLRYGSGTCCNAV